MLTFADTPWHLISISMVFTLGLYVAALQKKTFQLSTRYAVIIYVWHTIFCIVYYNYTIIIGGDALVYYLRSINMATEFKFGTAAITYITSIFSDIFKMSYGGVFLVYNLFGFIGMIAFASALQHIVVEKSITIRRVAFFVILLPGLSFWSSAIGKDSISFMGAGLVCWAVLNLNRRYPAMFVAILAFLLVRPHMAGILLGVFSVTMMMTWRANPIKKLTLTAIATPATIAGVVFGLQYAGLGDASGISDVAEYFEMRQGHNLGGGSSVDIAGMSVPMRLITYLFRPLFFDAPGLMGLVVSFENLIILILFLVFTSRLFTGKSQLSAFSRTFFTLFVIVSLFVLANTTANLGIAVRQKWMFLPMLFVLMFSYMGNPKVKPGDE